MAAAFSIKDFINNRPAGEKKLLDKSIVQKEINKGDFLLREGMQDNKIYYVVSGLLRKFIVIKEKEITLDFFFQDEIYFPKSTEGTAADVFIQALEKSAVFQLSLEQFEQIKTTAPHLAQLELKILEIAYLQTVNRLETFQVMNARERYLNLLQKSPLVVKRIPLIYVSTFLGINNASLSKIRRSIK